MKYTERREWLYDVAAFGKKDVQTALKIHRENTVKFSPIPPPTFMEVDRRTCKYDMLWHYPLEDRTHFSRVIQIPCLNTFKRPDWRLTKVGLVPQRNDTFMMDNLLLREANYFPTRGDMVFFNGYRYIMINIVLEPNGYWHQTNVWLGLNVECIIPPEGDARPLLNLGEAAPSELNQTSAQVEPAPTIPVYP